MFRNLKPDICHIRYVLQCCFVQVPWHLCHQQVAWWEVPLCGKVSAAKVWAQHCSLARVPRYIVPLVPGWLKICQNVLHGVSRRPRIIIFKSVILSSKITSQSAWFFCGKNGTEKNPAWFPHDKIRRMRKTRHLPPVTTIGISEYFLDGLGVGSWRGRILPHRILSFYAVFRIRKDVFFALEAFWADISGVCDAGEFSRIANLKMILGRNPKNSVTELAPHQQ